ncbi:uncharacterized protein ATNIH1004_000532 [Aspergillus tanneri]|uniref:Uncharacterized protein n=1 Tax=Aspergillus tanneri TaxID=1220188 RepID=A0A5M9MWY6_9EURO|nr:uncharacterized protein ATNIH1004_000532 [Aspergillus tanneri]KAA8651641.1 hypothetical protein ATNIH1004_000532 [Aspergillus tanneri]
MVIFQDPAVLEDFMNSQLDQRCLGTLKLWDLIQGKELFQRIHNAQGHYDARAHLAEIIN